MEIDESSRLDTKKMVAVGDEEIIFVLFLMHVGFINKCLWHHRV